jgi:biotin synthase
MNAREIKDIIEDPASSAGLFAEAERVRQQHCGDTVYLRGIIEFSSHCVRSCCYCGLRRQNRLARRYRMSATEVCAAADRVAEAGITTAVLQSGDDPWYSRDMLCSIIRSIKVRHPGMAVTLSIGERPLDDYAAFREAGADRYLLKHETANKRLYAALHPGQDLDTRVRILEHLRVLGYQVGAGCIVGLPGQTCQDLADDVLLLKQLDVDMAGIGPFVPQHATPLTDQPAGSVELTLRVLALARIELKNVRLPATTALGALDPEGQAKALAAGADVLMLNFTPDALKSDYAIYDNKQSLSLEQARSLILQAGRVAA